LNANWSGIQFRSMFGLQFKNTNWKMFGMCVNTQIKTFSLFGYNACLHLL
jgi:hypothetical protein